MATKKPKRKSGRIGRPPRPNAVDYRHVGFGLRLDLLAYARAKAVREHRSLSSALSDLIERGAQSERFDPNNRPGNAATALSTAPATADGSP